MWAFYKKQERKRNIKETSRHTALNQSMEIFSVYWVCGSKFTHLIFPWNNKNGKSTYLSREDFYDHVVTLS